MSLRMSCSVTSTASSGYGTNVELAGLEPLMLWVVVLAGRKMATDQSRCIDLAIQHSPADLLTYPCAV